MLKKELVFSIIGIIIIIALLLFYINQYNLNFQSLQKTAAFNQNQIQNTLNLSLGEVQKHNSMTSCWTIIDKNVYDVTQYVNQHPGRSFTISDYCGKDMTNAFITKGGQGAHSSFADTIHANILLGPLDGQINQQKLNQIQNLSQQYIRSSEEDDNDD